MSFMDDLKNKAGDLADKAKDVAGDVAEKAKDVAGDVGDRAQSLASDAKDRIDDLTHKGDVAPEDAVIGTDNQTAADLDAADDKAEDTSAPYA